MVIEDGEGADATWFRGLTSLLVARLRIHCKLHLQSAACVQAQGVGSTLPSLLVTTEWTAQQPGCLE